MLNICYQTRMYSSRIGTKNPFKRIQSPLEITTTKFQWTKNMKTMNLYLLYLSSTLHHVGHVWKILKNYGMRKIMKFNVRGEGGRT